MTLLRLRRLQQLLIRGKGPREVKVVKTRQGKIKMARGRDPPHNSLTSLSHTGHLGLLVMPALL